MYLEVIHQFDVWGNAKDGYEVNNQCRVGYIKTLGKNAADWPSKAAILRALKRLDLVKKTVRLSSIEWDDNYSDAIGINEKDGRPVYFVSRVWGKWRPVNEDYIAGRLPIARIFA